MTALPATGVALALPAVAQDTDPVLHLYREWLAAGEALNRLAEMPNWDMDSPEYLAADNRYDAAWSALANVTPTSKAGIAALTHVLWALDGPSCREGTPEYEQEAAYPINMVIAAAWRGASGLDGVPRPIKVDA